MPPPGPTTFTYLHTGHTRATSTNNVVFAEAAVVDYQSFDMLWLGGDLTYFSTVDVAQVAYLDSIFGLSKTSTLLAPGNHEYANDPTLLAPVTKRPLFYTHYQNGITFLVVDTQGDGNNIRGEQFALFKTITDTISESSHLIMLHHHLIWLMDGGALEATANSISNGAIGGCFHCLKENNFYETIYPILVEVQNRGVQVLCIGGDVGGKVTTYEHRTNDDIFFLASGLDLNEPTNQVLLFEHDTKDQSLLWRVELLENLPLR